MFVWSSPFLWGFINYWLATALAIAGLAVWKLLDDRRSLREPVFWAAIPFVFLAHAIAGCLMVMLIGAWELGRVAKPLGYRPVAIVRALFAPCRPLIAILPLVAWWRLSGTSVAGEQGDGTNWSFTSKFEELATILRDQHMVFDIACVFAAIGVIIMGWRRGARFADGTGWPVAAVWIAYLILPFSTEGGSYAAGTGRPDAGAGATGLADGFASPCPHRAADRPRGVRRAAGDHHPRLYRL